MDWFFEESGFELLDDLSDATYKEKLDSIIPLKQLLQKYQPDTAQNDSYFLREFLLWGLVEYNKLSKYRLSEGFRFKDVYGGYISGL